MQGVIRTYDPASGEGVVVRDTDRAEFVLAADALEGSIFRMLRQGQRVVFELDRRRTGRPGCASAPRSTWALPPDVHGLRSPNFPNGSIGVHWGNGGDAAGRAITRFRRRRRPSLHFRNRAKGAVTCR